MEALYKKIAHRDSSKIADVKKNLAEQRPGCEKQVGKMCIRDRLHSYFYFNDEIPTDADFEKSIGDYLTFEFSMIMQNREYLFEGGDVSEGT